jgi:hypothetical protein
MLELKSTTHCVGKTTNSSGRCIDLLTEPEEPRLPAVANALGQLFGPRVAHGFLIPLFSDLRRHNMGASLAEGKPHRGVAGNMWLTRPLWGLADTAPYLHDGRASTVNEAIVLHDGEGAPSRDAYLAAPESERAALRVFLMSLTREAKVLVQ